jgi:hypothetical protein
MIKMIISGKEFHDLDKMKKTLNVESISDEIGLKKEIAKGNHVYAFIDPKADELDEETILCWSTNKDDARERYYNLKEEI